ncbi:MAG: hypothetical protein PF638_08750 [Candidatus Delongbacteria bacterium]|jgi:hypothetical protein|nr:hypothetical protein [Candidatus Delongbacteria bacterium]
MKKLLILIITFNSLLFSQNIDDNEFFDKLYVDRQPSAKIESMGRCGVVVPDEMFSVFYNPAHISTINGVSVSSSIVSPYSMMDDSQFSFIGIGFSLKKKLSFGFSLYNYQSEKLDYVLPANIVLDNPESNDYKLTISLSPNRAFSIGVSGKYVSTNEIDSLFNQKVLKGYDMDVGIHQIVAVTRNRNFRQRTSIGISFINVFSADIGNYKLPRIMNTGVNFSFIPRVGTIIPHINSVLFTFTGEYQKMWDSDYHSGMKFGSELLVAEIVSLRCGYYWDKVNDKDETIYYDNPADPEFGEINYKVYEYIEEFTYGFGLNIPLYRFYGSKIPLNIKFDYANMKYPESNDSDLIDYDNINSYSLSVNWLMRMED